MFKRIWVAALFLSAMAWSTAACRAEELTAEQSKKVAEAVAKLDDPAEATRRTAEEELKGHGRKALPALSAAHSQDPGRHNAIRGLLVAMWLENYEFCDADGRALAEIAKQESREKRYNQGERAYTAAARIFGKLKGLWGERGNGNRIAEYTRLEARAEELSKKARVLAAGGTELKGVSIGGLRLGKETKITDDGNWDL